MVKGWRYRSQVEELREVYEMVRAYWERRRSEGANVQQAASELELPNTTFRRYAGISEPEPRPVAQRERFVERFVAVEVAERVLTLPVAKTALAPEEPASGAGAERVSKAAMPTVSLTLGDVRVESASARALLPILEKLK